MAILRGRPIGPGQTPLTGYRQGPA